MYLKQDDACIQGPSLLENFAGANLKTHTN